LASTSKDKTVKLWDVSARQERAELRGHKDWIWAVTFSPDGTTVASGCDDSMIKLWDAATGRERLTLSGHKGYVRSVAFSHDGKTLFSTDHWTIRSWDASTGKLNGAMRTIEGVAPLTCALPLTDEKTLAIGSHGTLKLWDVATGRERATLHGHTRQVSSVAMSPDGRTIVTTSFDGSARFWRTATAEEVSRQSSVLEPRDAVTLSGAKQPTALENDREAASLANGIAPDQLKQEGK
jgi:WD40 repeat protein